MPRARVQNAGPTNVVTTTETVAATLTGQSVPANAPIDLEGYVDITTGAGTTFVVVAIERGAAAGGVLVGVKVQFQVTAGNRVVVPINASDTFAGDVAGQQWVVTVQQTAATANGTINSAYITAIY